MTREQIEQAAIKKLPYSDEECSDSNYTLGKNVGFKRGFIAGAKWRINSVWHDASEIPQHSGLLIGIWKDGKAVLCGPNNSNWETTVKIFHIVRWAYLDDLLPERKEEAECGYVSYV